MTRIDYDHQQYLGTRLEEIAAEKAAIIRGGVALSAAQAPPAAAVVSPPLPGGRGAAPGRGPRPRRRGGPGRSGTPTASTWPWTAGRRAGAPGACRDVDLGAPRRLPAGQRRRWRWGPCGPSPRPAGAAASDDRADPGRAGPSVRWPGRFQVAARPGRRPAVRPRRGPQPRRAPPPWPPRCRPLPGGARLTLVIGISADKDRAGILKALGPPRPPHRPHRRPAPPGRRRPPSWPPTSRPGDAEARPGRRSPAAAFRLALADPAADVVCVAGSLFLVASAAGSWPAARRDGPPVDPRRARPGRGPGDGRA